MISFKYLTNGAGASMLWYDSGYRCSDLKHAGIYTIPAHSHFSELRAPAASQILLFEVSKPKLVVTTSAVLWFSCFLCNILLLIFS